MLSPNLPERVRYVSCSMLITVQMSKKIDGLRNNFLKLREGFESKGLKVNIVKSR